MLNVEGRHPAVAPYGNRFRTGHLPDGPLLTNALHDLWRSKNEAVLHAVEVQEARRDG